MKIRLHAFAKTTVPKPGTIGVARITALGRSDQLRFVRVTNICALWLGSGCRRDTRHGCLQSGTWKYANLPSAIALEAEESLPLAHAQKFHDRRKSPFAFVKCGIHAAQELLELPDVHRPAWL